jgi:hypothetical protein
MLKLFEQSEIQTLTTKVIKTEKNPLSARHRFSVFHENRDNDNVYRAKKIAKRIIFYFKISPDGETVDI